MKPTSSSAAELAILRILWERGPCTVREVHERVYAGTEVGYTSSLKLMQNLFGKGLVSRTETGRQHIYSAVASERPTLNLLVAGWIDNTFGGSSMALAMQALDARPAEPEELEALKAMIRRLEEASAAP